MDFSANKPLRKTIFTAGLLWVGLIICGMWIAADYSSAPGIAATPPAFWPAFSGLKHKSDRATLVMFAHPHCACTQASLRELALVMARCSQQVEAFVFVLKPETVSDHWEQTDLWHQAAGIPGITVRADDKGLVARSFGAATSGQVVLYDNNGALIFSGGITGARGHSGDNHGRHAIISLLLEGVAQRKTTPAFGCSLWQPSNECQVTNHLTGLPQQER